MITADAAFLIARERYPRFLGSAQTFLDARLNGKVLPGGNDWVVNREDGVMVIDVRLTL